jgi:hypothetical protein
VSEAQLNTSYECKKCDAKGTFVENVETKNER